MGEFCSRRSFGKNNKKIEISNLIDIQRKSYEAFLQKNVDSESRKLDGLQAIFKEVFSTDASTKNVVEFLSYSLEDPVFSEEDCIKKDLTYAARLKIRLRVTRYEGKGVDRAVKEIKEQEVYLADIPLMIKNATFIVNGVSRVVISQLHKSAGVFFDAEDLKGHDVKRNYSAHIVPFRGPWLDFQLDYKGAAWVRIDKRRKILLTTFLMLLGKEDVPVSHGFSEENYFSKSDILRKFYNTIKFRKTKIQGQELWSFDLSESFNGFVPGYDIVDEKLNIIVKANAKITNSKFNELKTCKKLFVYPDALLNYSVVDNLSIEGSLKIEAGSNLTEEKLKFFEEEVEVLDIDNVRISSYIKDAVLADKNNTYEEALRSFVKIVRPGESVNLDGAVTLFHDMFFNFDRYDLSVVGRIKMNSRLKKFYPESYQLKDERILSNQDFFAIIKGLIAVKEEKESTDDIDHLGFRRVRSVGELVANQFRGAMFKLVKSLKERLNVLENDEELNLHDVVNSKVLIASLREFFGTSQLSQMVDNINGLAEVSHKRRITAMGPGGLDSLSATFEVRDVHSSHYGRICAVETPEGPNIGLINYLSMHAKIDEHGFIKTPYYKVVNSQVTDEVFYLNASEEEQYAVASYCVGLDDAGKITDEYVSCRKGGDYIVLKASEVEYMDVASGQILSVAASLIPFIENDDPNRALMGSNMQRQALPLKNREAPLVGTGVERQIGMDSFICVVADYDGKVVQLDSSKILVQRTGELDKIDIYNLVKYQRSNVYSCVNNIPMVSVGDYVKKGQLLADGSTTYNGEISLGKNLKVAFMSFKGYTYEDAVIISDKLQNETLTSVRIEEFEVDVKEGEEITRAIPGISDEFLNSLDETGLVYLGAKVKPGSILVGKVAPRVERPLTPEERLLKAMFGDKADNVVDSSLRLPPGGYGTVVDLQIVTKKGAEKDERTLFIERIEIQKLLKAKEFELSNISNNYKYFIIDLLENKKVAVDTDTFPKGLVLDSKFLEALNLEDLFSVVVDDEKAMKEIAGLKMNVKFFKDSVNKKFDLKIKSLQEGDVLPAGVMKHVKIFVATNRVIEPGDKIAGRHGNKGVIAKVLPVCDMPYDENGEPVDMILNTLSLAARMNIGQVLETHLGMIAKEIGNQVSAVLASFENGKVSLEDLRVIIKKAYPKDIASIDNMNQEELVALALEVSDGLKFAVPSFDSARMNDIKNLFKEWGLSETGQFMLRDGETGKQFDQPITVGYMYINKLNHMVADKIHARSTGSYSLITQQPPGGKAKMGGQRQGEMETWALEAYGAAYITRESMTIKSDDHAGRLAAYEAITQGYDVTNENYYTPEAFKILQSEMRCIGINFECVNKVANDEGGQEYIPALSNSKFDALRISLMSPEKIRKISFGEIKRSETINYRTQKAELEGLHCPAIFGPEKDYKCSCGRYNKMKYKGVICEKCGVEVTVSRVRRERMGHIELACPVAHIWFSKILPSRIGSMIGLASKDLDKVLRYERYIVTNPGTTLLEKGQLLKDDEYQTAVKEYGSHSFAASMGAEGLENYLKTLNLEEERLKLIHDLDLNPSEMQRKKLIKKLHLVEGFIKTNTRPEWMILRTLPVMPADLRPLVPLDAGRFATSDVNELYRKIINRNNRLKELQSYDFPEIVLRNEKRMLQNSVDALIDNARLDKPFTASNGRPLQSIGDALKGKHGRFRQNLLGKRVDYSGRSVIVVGPKLKLHQCGLPKKMALELFKPFVYARLEQYGYAATIKSAKRIVEEQRPEVWEILKEVTYQHPVLLNRAPTLHRLGIQAFEIVLVDHNAIELHPLVCTAYNADFDGDQMSVHLPLSVEAQIEARVLMMPTNNMISPSNGKTVLSPKKDMVLGLYYLTDMKNGKEVLTFHQDQIPKLLESEKINLQAKINCYVNCPVEGYKMFETTAGRIMLFNILPENHSIAFKTVNKLIVSKDTMDLFTMVWEGSSSKECAKFADDFMTLGFHYATISGVSCSYSDILVPTMKTKVVSETWKSIEEYKKQYNDGLITEDERKSNVANAWYKCDEKIGKEMEVLLSAKKEDQSINSLYMMYHSGARGSTAQMRQMMSMRGFIAKTDGQLLENAVSKNYAEGLDPHSYYLTTHGTRKGLSDMALKTADAGYFTRKLVDVSQDCIITSKDCLAGKSVEEKNTENCINFDAKIENGDTFDFSLAFGRVLASNVYDPATGDLILEENDMLDKEKINLLEKHQILNIKIRSPITCLNEFGICSKCYGMDLSKYKEVSIGEAVGIIAAQSIGEPGAQLTMRTFHTGGAAKYTKSDSSLRSYCDGKISFKNLKYAVKSDGTKVVTSRYGEFKIIDSFNREREVKRIPYGSILHIEENSMVKLNDLICEWDENVLPKLSSVNAFASYVDLIEGVSLKTVIDESTGLSSRIVNDWRKGLKKATLNPSICFKDEKGNYIFSEDGSKIVYQLEPEDTIMFNDGEKVEIGDLIIKRYKKASVSSDITTGLPRLVEIFEARVPKVQALISKVDGVVAMGKDYRTKKCIVIVPEDGSAPIEYIIPKDLNLTVQISDPVKKGDMLCDGDISAHDILKVMGTQELVKHLLRSVREIFNSQGIVVDNKHVECILRYMMRKVEIVDAGSSSYIVGDHLEYLDFVRSLNSFEQKPKAIPVLLGITRAASLDASFIKAASFQESHKVFVQASLTGQIDSLMGMKQRLITGHLIPAGTGAVLSQWEAEFKKQHESSSISEDVITV